MFDHFTMSASTHRLVSTSRDISPCDTRSSSPPSPLSSPATKHRAHSHSTIPELAFQLDDLEPQKDDISSSYFSSIPHHVSAHDRFLAASPEYENQLIVDPEYEMHAKSAPSSPLPRSTRVCRRLQRQINSQLLCTPSQVKAVSELVEAMVSTKSQCNVTTTISAPPQSSGGSSYISMSEGMEPDDNILPDLGLDDEGYCEGELDDYDDDFFSTEALMMNLRRASAPAGIRRSGYGKGVVFAPPRMRKKILRRKRADDGP